MVFGSNTGGPMILGCSMIRGWISSACFLIKVFTVGAAGNSVVVPEETSLPKFWHKQLSDIFE
jgi:hypothetical protein